MNLQLQGRRVSETSNKQDTTCYFSTSEDLPEVWVRQADTRKFGQMNYKCQKYVRGLGTKQSSLFSAVCLLLNIYVLFIGFRCLHLCLTFNTVREEDIYK
jgi:hypothetical protein